MSSGAALALCAGAFCLVYVALAWRAYGLIRGGHREWRERWRLLDAGRRHDIMVRLRDGQPVSDPEEAELALLALDRFEFIRHALRPITYAFTLLVLIELVAGLILGVSPAAVLGAIGVVFVGSLELSTRRRVARMHESAAATRRSIAR